MNPSRTKRNNTTTFLSYIIVAVASSFCTLLAAYKWPGIMDIFAPATETAALDKDSVNLKDAPREAEASETQTPATAAASATTTETSDASTHDFAEGTALYVNGDGVRLRTGPGLSYEVYAKVSTGQTLTYNYTSGEWYCVKYNGRNLFINKEFATTKITVAKPAKAPAPDTQSSKTPKDPKASKNTKPQTSISDKPAAATDSPAEDGSASGIK